ncbi:MAG: SIMPL domain-containing protein [Actinomycetota bacterium]|nr:SIMPL domain-containing protein [Actinomycetota bacterium]
MKIIRIAAAALLVLAVAALAGIGVPETAGGASDDAREGITVTGVGHVDAVPDEAEFSLGITTKGQTARAALTANSARMQRLIAALKAAGVDERDIKTQDVSVGQNYDGGAEKTDGYTATNSVSVRIRELDRAGAVLEAASQAGANQVYGPALTREDREGLEQKALEGAVANARKRAQTLAKAAGVDVGRVTAIVEGVQQPGVLYEARAAMDSASTEVPIEKGTEKIQASVTVTFAIE